MPPDHYLGMAADMLPLMVIIRLIALFSFKLHKSIWQYASIMDLNQIIKAISISSAFIVAITMALDMGHPRSIFIVDWLLLIVGLSGVRFIIRLTRPIRRRRREVTIRSKRALIVGAGDACEMILREIVCGHNYNYQVIGLVDDDPKKYKKSIHGIQVLGKEADIPAIVEKEQVQEIIIAIPSIKSAQMKKIVDYCIESGAKYRTVPNIADVVNGTVKMKELRDVNLEDLLQRDPVFLDKAKIKGYIEGQTVLITGAGGSIGSELCAQVVTFSPKKLILLEKSENPLFYIDKELESFGSVIRVPIIGDICDRKRVKEVFDEHKPQIVFHAAAHKHVPLMESNAMEAIKNNVFGAKIVAEEAIKAGANLFVMLSTDKAVAPESIMGVSKRVTEKFITALDNGSWTRFMVVRFGNVLGSEGSVIPTFKKQIEKGGPITVTHPDIKRYFMTIPEAAGLVLEVGSIGNGGEIFILEMSMQIKIVNLAKDLIRLSGLEEDAIEIIYTGLRPGEKMYEELVSNEEKLAQTQYEKIRVIKTQQGESTSDIFKDIEDLEEIIRKGEIGSLITKLKEIEPSYKPSRKLSKFMLKEEVEVLEEKGEQRVH